MWLSWLAEHHSAKRDDGRLIRGLGTQLGGGSGPLLQRGREAASHRSSLTSTSIPLSPSLPLSLNIIKSKFKKYTNYE